MPTQLARKPVFVKHATDDGVYWVSSRSKRELHTLLREKYAAIGGDQEQGFEQAFSSLAYAYLRDAAPRLIDYIVGFQLVDRTDDNTKAVGVFGFKVGKNWLYAPVFFINNELKGHELLYLKSQDTFIPLKENWINYVMSRKPHILGEGSQKDVYQLGALAPNIERLAWPPAQSKFGSANELIIKTADAFNAAMSPPALSPNSIAQSLRAPAMHMARPQGVVTSMPSPVEQRFLQQTGIGNMNQLRQLAQARGIPFEQLQSSLNSFGNQSQLAAAFTAGNATTPHQYTPPPMRGPAPSVGTYTPPAMAMGGDMVGTGNTGGQGEASGAINEGTKFGRDVYAWAKAFLPLYASCATKEAQFIFRGAKPGDKIDMTKLAAYPFKAAFINGYPDLEDFLASDWRFAKAAWDIAQEYPLIKRGFDRFYGADLFARVGQRSKEAFLDDVTNVLPAKVAQVKPRTTDSLIPEVIKTAYAPPAVKILTDDDVEMVINWPKGSDDDKKKLLHHGYLVKDERTGTEISRAYNTQVKQVLSNPQESGLHEVLEAPGEFDRMLVILHPYSNKGKAAFATVVRLEGDTKAWLNAHPSSLFAKHSEPVEEYREWFDGLPKAAKLVKGDTYIAVSESADGTVPFVVREVFDDGRYKVDFLDSVDYNRGRRSSNLPRTLLDDPQLEDNGNYVSSWDALLIVGTRKHDRKLRAISGELHVPSSFKFFKLKESPKSKENDSGSLILASGGGEDVERPIEPGDLADVQTFFTEKTASLKIYGDNNEATILTEKRGYERNTWRGALFCLIRNHGLSEKQAAEMLKEAQRKGTITYRVKYADYYPYPGPGPGAPTIPAPEYGTEPMGYNNVRSQYPQEEDLPVPGLEASRTDPRIYDPFLRITPDQGAMNTAQQASQQGQKEVFDTSMISGLLKATRQDSMVNRHLGALMKAVDALGRILFSYYWNGEEFEDRYGRSTMPELEDSLRNTFENLGDLTLMLKAKTVEPGDDNISDPNIDSVARS